MKLIVGLGNPGRKYAGTRHNVGFDALDLLAERHRLAWESGPADALIAKWRTGGALLAKPLTFMNLSGHAVGELLRFFKIDQRRPAGRRGRRGTSISGGCGRGRRVRRAGTTG